MDPTPSTTSWTAIEGTPSPLGVSWDESAEAYNFALYSKHAQSVTLLLYTEADLIIPVFMYRLDYLKNKSGRVWHCRVAKADARDARFYAYAVAGPKPEGRYEWHCFDADKILLDPYAKSVYFPPTFDRTAAMRPGSNAGKAPLGLLSRARHDVRLGRGPSCPPPSRTSSSTKCTCAGLRATPTPASVLSSAAPTCGLVEKIPYLKDLGITAVELMPVFQFDPQEGNYWGYMPLNFFAPHHGYARRHAACDQHNEFRAMVKALHAADIEVILDVVYNHTAEGDQHGPIYSYKGIDNSTYYLIVRQSATSPTRISREPATRSTVPTATVRKMIVDSLRYWVEEMHVDGFRFDLASVFTRNDDGSLNLRRPADHRRHHRRSRLADVRLIAEPGTPAGAYQLGRGFPARRWCQWNGRFRDDVRRFVRGDPASSPQLMRRLYGSDDLFPGRPDARLPSLSERQLRHLSRRLHACTTWSPTTRNTTRPTATTTRTARPRTTVGTAAGKATSMSREDVWNCASDR